MSCLIWIYTVNCFLFFEFSVYLDKTFSCSPVRNHRELLLSVLLRHQGRRHTLKFYVQVFYVMGKALSGELSFTWTDLF